MQSIKQLSKIFNVTDFYEHYPTEQLYPDYNSRTSSFEEGGTDVGNQSREYQHQQVQFLTAI